LLNFRPEYRGDWMQRSYYRQLPLRPLGPQEIADLLRHLLGADPALDGLAAQIQARTAGNPFFIEEVVQSLVETGQLQGQRGAYQLRGPIEALKIPPTVQPLLAARIDRLSEHAKHVLQAAAVLGQQIAESVLVEIVDLTADDVAAALRQLVAAEFLHPVALYPEPEFAFKHPLTEEVAYSAQLGDRRARLHGRAAEALERRLRDTHGELAAVLAQHWERAGEALRAARWYRRAAERTTMTHSRPSFQHWSKVRALADRLPESPEQQELATLARVQMFGVGARISAPEEEMAELFRECDAIVRRSGSNDARAQLMTGYGFYRLYTTGNVLAASDDAATAIELADRSGNVALRLGAYFMACAVHIPRDLQRALDTIQLAFDVIATDPAAGRMVLSTGFRADVAFLFIRTVVLSLMARLDDAEDVVGRLRSLAQETDEAVGLAHGAAARLALERGDDAAAEREVTRVLEAAEASGNLSGALNGYSNRGELLLRQGRYPEALAALETAMTIHRRQRVFRQLEPSTLALAVAARLYMGDVGAAQAIAREALTMAVDRGLLLGEFAVRLRLAEISLVRNGADGRETVEQELARATELVEQTHLYAQRPTIHVLRARLAAAAGDGAERDRQVHEAVRLCDAMGAPLRARRVVRDLAH